MPQKQSGKTLKFSLDEGYFKINIKKNQLFININLLLIFVRTYFKKSKISCKLFCFLDDLNLLKFLGNKQIFQFVAFIKISFCLRHVIIINELITKNMIYKRFDKTIIRNEKMIF